MQAILAGQQAANREVRLSASILRSVDPIVQTHVDRRFGVEQ
jgi:hypothetical protein